ncbi:hypothetical protein LTR10_008619 [Elasticomyces elasticus]|nr:hypothetical protein LTR10_008619 [Elasticomyces elasticus]KAK4967490.1 hypothetical protein LTR42_010839 [Elasticomyces elasticus]
MSNHSHTNAGPNQMDLDDPEDQPANDVQMVENGLSELSIRDPREDMRNAQDLTIPQRLDIISEGVASIKPHLPIQTKEDAAVATQLLDEFAQEASLVYEQLGTLWGELLDQQANANDPGLREETAQPMEEDDESVQDPMALRFGKMDKLLTEIRDLAGEREHGRNKYISQLCKAMEVPMQHLGSAIADAQARNKRDHQSSPVRPGSASNKPPPKKFASEVSDTEPMQLESAKSKPTQTPREPSKRIMSAATNETNTNSPVSDGSPAVGRAPRPPTIRVTPKSVGRKDHTMAEALDECDAYAPNVPSGRVAAASLPPLVRNQIEKQMDSFLTAAGWRALTADLTKSNDACAWARLGAAAAEFPPKTNEADIAPKRCKYCWERGLSCVLRRRGQRPMIIPAGVDDPYVDLGSPMAWAKQTSQ